MTGETFQYSALILGDALPREYASAFFTAIHGYKSHSKVNVSNDPQVTDSSIEYVRRRQIGLCVGDFLRVNLETSQGRRTIECLVIDKHIDPRNN